MFGCRRRRRLRLRQLFGVFVYYFLIGLYENYAWVEERGGVSINNKAQTKRIFLFMSTHNTHPIQVETNVYVTVGAINYGAMDMDGWMDGLICLSVFLSDGTFEALTVLCLTLSLSGSWCNIIRQAFLSFLSELFIYTSQKCQ